MKANRIPKKLQYETEEHEKQLKSDLDELYIAKIKELAENAESTCEFAQYAKQSKKKHFTQSLSKFESLKASAKGGQMYCLSKLGNISRVDFMSFDE